MAFSQGSRAGLSYVAETVFGTTPVTPSLIQLPYTTSTLNLTKERVTGNDIQPDRMPRTDRHGNRTAAGDITVEAASASEWTTVVLGTTYSTTSGGNTAVTGFNFTPAINKTYAIEGFFLLTTTVATTGPRPGVHNWPSGLGTGSAARIEAPNSATASAQANLVGGTIGLALSTGLPTTGGNGYMALLDAVMRTTSTTSGAFEIGLGSETAGTSVSMLAGSYFRYREIA